MQARRVRCGPCEPKTLDPAPFALRGSGSRVPQSGKGLVSLDGLRNCCDVRIACPTSWDTRRVVLGLYARLGRSRVLLGRITVAELVKTPVSGGFSSLAYCVRGVAAETFEVFALSHTGSRASLGAADEGEVFLAAWWDGGAEQSTDGRALHSLTATGSAGLGGAVALSSESLPCRSVLVQAHEDNTDICYVGGPNVLASTGIALSPGMSAAVDAEDANLVYVLAESAEQTVRALVLV